MRFATRTISLALAGSLLFTAVPSGPAAFAAPQDGSLMASASINTVSDQQMKQLERDIETLFTRYVVESGNGKFEVKYENIYADGAEAHLDSFEMLAESFNLLGESSGSEFSSPGFNNSSLGKLAQPQNAGDFAWCVLSTGLGFDIIKKAPGLVDAVRTAVRAWNWGLAASTVARILGPSVVRALGDPWLIASQLGIAAYKCRGAL